MKQITVRGIPDEVERVIRKGPERKGLILNKAFILLLEKAVGMKGKERKKGLHTMILTTSLVSGQRKAIPFRCYRNCGCDCWCVYHTDEVFG